MLRLYSLLATSLNSSQKNWPKVTLAPMVLPVYMKDTYVWYIWYNSYIVRLVVFDLLLWVPHVSSWFPLFFRFAGGNSNSNPSSHLNSVEFCGIYNFKAVLPECHISSFIDWGPVKPQYKTREFYSCFAAQLWGISRTFDNSSRRDSLLGVDQ